MPIKDKAKAREYFKEYMRRQRNKNKGLTVKPRENILVKPVKPSSCSRCSELEESLTNFYNLVIQEQEETKKLRQTIHQLNKKLTQEATTLNKDKKKKT